MAARSRDLTPEANETLRGWMRDLMAARPDLSTQTALAEALGVDQGTISAFLSGRQGSSFQVALQVAAMLDRDLFALLGLKRPAPLHPAADEPSDDRYPERAAAIAGARAIASIAGFTEDDFAEVASMRLNSEIDPGMPFWWGQLTAARDRRRFIARAPGEATREAERARATMDEIKRATKPTMPTRKR